MKVQDILTDESKWTRGTDARDADGESVDWASPKAVCWCLNGAIQAAYGRGGQAKVAMVRDILKQRKKIKFSQGIGPWNDSSRTTFKQVQKLIKELDL